MHDRITERENLPAENHNSEPNRRRSEVLKLRLTPSELEEIENFARKIGKTKTDSVLNAIRNHYTIIADEMPEILYELQKQGRRKLYGRRICHSMSILIK